MSVNKIKAEIQASKLIQETKSSAIMADCKSKELSPLETAQAMFHGIDMVAFGKTIKLVNLIVAFARDLYDDEDSALRCKSLYGYSLILNGQIETDDDLKAMSEWSDFHTSSKTKMDVLDWVLTHEGVAKEDYWSRIVSRVDKVDLVWYLEHLQKTDIMDFLVHAYTKETHDAGVEKAKVEIKANSESVKASEHMHKLLMSDPDQSTNQGN